jgi:hypothetical integral membrane protein (TIGR02206 family)
VQRWSAEHLAALAATAVAAAALVAGARLRAEAWARAAGRALAVVIAAGFVVEQAVYAGRGEWSIQVNLPLQLSDAVTFASVAALWRPDEPLLSELVWLWALSASLQAILTPDLQRTFPDPLFFTYFATHSGAIAAACLLVIGMRRAPRPGATGRVYAITAAFAAVAALATVLTDGNYLFLRRKPAEGSLLDVMGPWPLYIVTGALLAWALFTALAALGRAAAARRPPS